MKKFCKNCIHHQVINQWHCCTRDGERAPDPVTGQSGWTNELDAYHERSSKGECGTEAKFFEKKLNKLFWS